jgi:general secretion pathway protein I
MMTRCRGFALLEVLVAFTILATVMGVLFQIFSSGLNRARLAEEYSRAALIAESTMARLGTEEALLPGTNSGRVDDTYRWQMTVAPYDEEEPDAQTPAALGLRPYRITVQIMWGEGTRQRVVPFTTVRLLQGLQG